jgi:predicted nucleic acid-binding protein
MSYLLDTNVLARSIEENHPMHEDAARCVEILLNQDEMVCVLPQNLIEFWNVCTRPADRNGLGQMPEIANQHITRFEQVFVLLPDTPAIFHEWKRLVGNHAVSGAQVHDARIVAAMNVHGVDHLITFNDSDFRRYEKVSIFNPREIVAEYDRQQQQP